jgi:DNA-binding MarR family transcriptional regulator
MSEQTHTLCESSRADDSMATPDPFSRVQQDEVSRCSGSITMLARLDLLHLIQAVAGALRKQWDMELRAQIPELSAPRAAVILQLGRGGGGSQTRLARLLGLSQMTVSRLLDGLERHGWIHREPMPADRRAWAVRLTAEGKRVLVAIHAARRTFVDRICVALDDERRTILLSTLAALESGTAAVPPASAFHKEHRS